MPEFLVTVLSKSPNKKFVSRRSVCELSFCTNAVRSTTIYVFLCFLTTILHEMSSDGLQPGISAVFLVVASGKLYINKNLFFDSRVVLNTTAGKFLYTENFRRILARFLKYSVINNFFVRHLEKRYTIRSRIFTLP